MLVFIIGSYAVRVTGTSLVWACREGGSDVALAVPSVVYLLILVERVDSDIRRAAISGFQKGKEKL